MAAQEMGKGLTSAEEDLKLISGLAREAGQIALKFFGKSPKTWLKEGDSPVSEADFAADAFLKEKLLAARPHYGWISEETADERAPAEYQRYFVVDPIDGTRGFLSGNPEWCVSVAVVENSRPIAGALDCPALDQHWTGVTGGEPLLNGALLFSGGGRLKNEAELLAQHPVVSCRKKDMDRLPAEFAEAAERAEHIPSLAYRLALLARGELDFVLVRKGCHDWDIAAVDLILELCGGALCNLKGERVIYCQKPYEHSFLLGAKQDNLQAMLDIVASSDLR